MKKIIVLMMVAICTSCIVMAQYSPGFRFSVGPELDLATGVFRQTHSVGVGASIQIEKSLQQNLYATASTGISIYGGKSTSGSYANKNVTIIPIKVGIKYFLVGGVYAAAQLGVGIFGNNTNFNGTHFAYTPQFGYEFKTKSGKAVDASFKYDGYSAGSSIGTLESVGFRVAYIF